MERRIFCVAIVALGISMASSQCGKKSSSGSPAPAAATPAGQSTSTASSDINPLAFAFPESLALSIFPQDTTGSSLRVRLAGDTSANADIKNKTLAEKVAESSAIAEGKADSCLPSSLSKTFNKENDETCYAFDQDMLYGTKNLGTNAKTATWLGTTTGKASSGEACLVAFTRNQVLQITAMVDQTLGFGMAALCQAKMSDGAVALPAIGETLDLTTALTTAVGSKGTITVASIERLADVEARPVFRLSIKAALGASGKARTIGIIHSPKAIDDNSVYNGTLYMQMSGDIVDATNLAKKSRVLSIVYAKTVTNGSSRIKAELRTATVDANLLADAINAQGVVDFNNGADFNGAGTESTYGSYTGFATANDAFNGMTYITFNMDTKTNEGSLAYWKNPGGAYKENARGFNITIAKNSAGALAGCATSGAASTDFTDGISIRRYLKEGGKLTLEPKGFYHPFLNKPTGASATDATGAYYEGAPATGQISKWYIPLITDNQVATSFASAESGAFITRQCFAQNTTSGVYQLDSTKMTEIGGYEILDPASAVNKAKLIALPTISTDVGPIAGDLKKVD